MARILTEQEVASTGGVGGYTTNLCCTAGRAGALNCNVTSPSGAASNQLITGVSRKAAAVTVTGHRLWVYTDPLPHISGSGGTSNALTVTVRYYTTYSDGTESYSTVSSSATITYNTTSSDSAPSSWYSSSSYGRITVEQNPNSSARTVGYAWAKATYNGYSANDKSTVIQDGYTPSGPTVTGHYLYTYTYGISNIAGSGGTSAVPDFYVRYYTQYSDGTEDYTDVTSSATIRYGKNSSRTEPSSWSSSSSGCQYTVGANSSSSATTVGYAFVKATYNGYSDSDSSVVNQNGYTAPATNDFKYHWSGQGWTTPVLQLLTSTGSYDSNHTAYSSGRYGGENQTSGTVSANWLKTGTIRAVYIHENPGFTQFALMGYDGRTYLAKTTFSNYTVIPLTRTFNTSEYTNGSYGIYAYFYKP